VSFRSFDIMCVGPTVTPFRFQIAIEHPSQGGMCLFEIQFFSQLPSHLLIEFMNMVQVYAFQERFEAFHARVLTHLTPFATVRLDRNIESCEEEEIDEIMATLSDRGEFYVLVPVGENAWEHIPIAEDPLGERIQHTLYTYVQ